MSTILDALRKARNNSPEAVVMDEEKVLTQRVEECPPLVSEAPREQLQLMKAVLAFAALVIVAMCVVLVFILAKALKPQTTVDGSGERPMQVAGAVAQQPASVGAVTPVNVPPAPSAPVAPPVGTPQNPVQELPRPRERDPRSPVSVPPPTFPQVVGGEASLPMVPVPPEEDPLDETHVQVLKGLLDEQAAAGAVQGAAPAAAVSRPEPVAAPKPRKETGELTLDGIVYTEQNPVAMINGEVVPVGGTIGKARVTRITPDLVVLERDGKTIELRQK
jgi:hypothetical protein